MEVKNWTVFGLLDPDFISNIKIACVFGKLKRSFPFTVIFSVWYLAVKYVILFI